MECTNVDSQIVQYFWGGYLDLPLYVYYVISFCSRVSIFIHFPRLFSLSLIFLSHHAHKTQISLEQIKQATQRIIAKVVILQMQN